jgi:hypothetical protein
MHFLLTIGYEVLVFRAFLGGEQFPVVNEPFANSTLMFGRLDA